MESIYEYTLKLTLIKSGIDFSSDRKKYLTMLSASAKNYNDKSNGKKITVNKDSLGEKSVILSLTSPFELEQPGKAIRLFSKFLIESYEEFRNQVTQGKLFVTTEAAMVEGEAIDPETIDDAAFVTAIVHVLLNKTSGTSNDYKRTRRTINRMKIIAKQDGLL